LYENLFVVCCWIFKRSSVTWWKQFCKFSYW